MEDVSDPPFRTVCKQNGADLMYTEFISSEGLIRDVEKIEARAKLVGVQAIDPDQHADAARAFDQDRAALAEAGAPDIPEAAGDAA